MILVYTVMYMDVLEVHTAIITLQQLLAKMDRTILTKEDAWTS